MVFELVIEFTELFHTAGDYTLRYTITHTRALARTHTHTHTLSLTYTHTHTSVHSDVFTAVASWRLLTQDVSFPLGIRTVPGFSCQLLIATVHNDCVAGVIN
jgi:hypothetical protein